MRARRDRLMCFFDTTSTILLRPMPVRLFTADFRTHFIFPRSRRAGLRAPFRIVPAACFPNFPKVCPSCPEKRLCDKITSVSILFPERNFPVSFGPISGKSAETFHLPPQTAKQDDFVLLFLRKRSDGDLSGFPGRENPEPSRTLRFSKFRALTYRATTSRTFVSSKAEIIKPYFNETL